MYMQQYTQYRCSNAHDVYAAVHSIHAAMHMMYMQQNTWYTCSSAHDVYALFRAMGCSVPECGTARVFYGPEECDRLSEDATSGTGSGWGGVGRGGEGSGFLVWQEGIKHGFTC